MNDVPYRWRLRMGEKDSTVTLQGSESSGQQVVITLAGIRNPWLAMPEEINRVVVTPALVRELINEAIRRGWKPNERVAPIKFEFVLNASA